MRQAIQASLSFYLSGRLGYTSPVIFQNFRNRQGDKMEQRILIAATVLLAVSSIGMGRNHNQYDQEAREQEKARKQLAAEARASEESRRPVKNMAAGIKELTYDNVRDVTKDTVHGTATEAPIVGTLDGTRQAGTQVVDNTIRGVKKVASLGFAKDDSYEIEEAQKGSGDAAKIKLFKF
jgi:hypothetical protein